MDKAALALTGLVSRSGWPSGLLGGANRAFPQGGKLRGVDWSPVPGALSAILGPPGAGKSALLRAIAGRERVRGTIVLDGAPIGWRRGVGVMLRGDTLEAAATLARNVAAPLRRAGVRRAAHARLVAEALDMVELADAASIRADRASPAQRQRARLARAIVAAPRVLLLDEPFSDHGPRARAALIGALRRIHVLLGATTLLATEEGADALAVADEIAIMQHGVIEQHGPTEEVFDRPHSARTAALFGEVNRLPGIVDALDDEIAMVRLDCGPTVEALAGPGLREHEACVMTLRPDRVAVANVTAAELGGDALDASLIEQQFQGDSYRLRLLIGTGAELVVKRPAAAAKLKIGARVALAWQPQHAHAFRAKQDVLF